MSAFVLPQAPQAGSRTANRPVFTVLEKPPFDGSLQSEIDALKNPAPYQARFLDPSVQELTQAIDILARLQASTYGDSARVGFNKLKRAKFHLEDLLVKALEG